MHTVVNPACNWSVGTPLPLGAQTWYCCTTREFTFFHLGVIGLCLGVNSIWLDLIIRFRAISFRFHLIRILPRDSVDFEANNIISIWAAAVPLLHLWKDKVQRVMTSIVSKGMCISAMILVCRGCCCFVHDCKHQVVTLFNSSIACRRSCCSHACDQFWTQHQVWKCKSQNTWNILNCTKRPWWLISLGPHFLICTGLMMHAFLLLG